MTRGHAGNRRPFVRDLRAHAADGRAGDPLLAERRRRLRRRLPALRGHGGRVRLDARGRADVADRARRAAAGGGGLARDAPRHAAARGRGRRSRPSRSCAGSPSRSWRWSRRPISSTRRSTGARSAGSASRSASRASRSSPLSGVNAEVVVTVAWDISWYQYRVSPDSDNPVRLEGRGHDPERARGRVHRAGTRTWTTTAGSSRTSPGSRPGPGWRPPQAFVY